MECALLSGETLADDLGLLGQLHVDVGACVVGGGSGRAQSVVLPSMAGSKG